MYHLRISTLLFILLFSTASAQIINIPGDYNLIQEGIDAAEQGDTVLVDVGEYFENLNMKGKNIVLCSHYALTNDPADILSTVINGSAPANPDTASCILIVSGEDSDCILQGFTIKGGKGTVWEDEHGPGNFYREGGGILIQYSSPTIKNNRLIGNEAINDEGLVSGGGGGIRSGDGNPAIHNNTLLYNLGKYGAGIVLNYSGASIHNNIIAYNSGGEDYGGGGIWSVSNGSEPITIENNTIVYNHSDQVAGGIRLWSSIASVMNNIIWGNTAPSYPQIHGGNNLTYNCIQGGYSGIGNIDLDPEFESGSYLLAENSPCIDSGNPELSYNDPEDPGNPGNALFPSMGTLLNDMGVYGGGLSMEMTSVITGLKPPVANELFKLQLSPNPVNDNLQILIHTTINQNYSIKIVDSQSSLILEKDYILPANSSSEIDVNLNEYPPGMYYLIVISQGINQTKKIVKR